MKTMKAIKEFYDKTWSSKNTIDEDRKILDMRSESIQYSYTLAEPLHGKKLLEIGCGAGFQTLEFAKRGAIVTAIDFSESGVRNTKALIAQLPLNANVRPRVLQMNAESLDFADSSFDIIYINSVLMHANKRKVLQECSRVLRKGGKVIIVEPLNLNLFLFPYRLFFSPYRKTKPRYMSMRLFKRYATFFSAMRHKEFYFFSTLLLPVKSGWIKKAVRRGDEALLKVFPFLGNLYWVSVVKYRK